MSPTLLPFLYRTQTLQRAWRTAGALSPAQGRLLHASTRCSGRDDAIPFEWEDRAGGQGKEAPDGTTPSSTITPAEAVIFKGIFDEISKGKMPKPRKRPAAPDSSSWEAKPVPQGSSSQPGSAPRSIVEQARLTEFSDNYLKRYPKSLQTAAQVALGLFTLEPAAGKTEASTRIQMPELHEAEAAKAAERERFEKARMKERERIDKAMTKCTTDAALWKIMQQEVFSLPEKLGIAQAGETKAAPKKGKRGAKKTAPEAENIEAALTTPKADKDRYVMDIHGPLYSHFLSTGLALLDTAFAAPSPYAFQILPRIKALGLPSYVLGVSTPFYARLARMYWNQFGDAGSALDVLQEMNSVGLRADGDVADLLVRIRDHVHGCSWGAQGAFVMAVMESPPYDGGLMQRLEEMERHVKRSLREEAV